MTFAFTIRQRWEGVFTDQALAGLVGTETVVTAASLGDLPLPVQLGRYRITGVTRVKTPDALSGSSPRPVTDVLISLDRIEEPPGTEPSGEDRNHAQDPDQTRRDPA